MTPLTANAFLDRFAKTFTPAPFHALARSAQWLRRKGKIDACEFRTALVFAQLSALRLTLNAQIQGLSRPVARQSFHERFTAAAVTYFKAAFTHCRQKTLGWEPAQPMAAARRQHCAAVYLLDSTAFDVPASLAAAFPACGGDGSPAKVKVLLRYELISGRLERSGCGRAKAPTRGWRKRSSSRCRRMNCKSATRASSAARPGGWRRRARRFCSARCRVPSTCGWPGPPAWQPRWTWRRR